MPTDEENKQQQLKSVMDTLTDGLVFRLRSASFLMQGAGGLGQPDSVSFLGTKYVGVDEAAEKQLWGYINGLPEYFKREVSQYFGYLKDEYKPSNEQEQA